MLFETLGVSDEEFLAVVRDASDASYASQRGAASDIDESPAAPTLDEQMFERRTAAEIDSAVVAWIHDLLRTPREKLDAMNVAFEQMRPQTPEQRAYFEKERAGLGEAGAGVETFADLLDMQEDRLRPSPAQ